MRLRLLANRVLATGYLQRTGDVVEVSIAEGDRMILGGQAEAIVERAVAEPRATETTSTTPSEPRRKRGRGEQA